MLLSEFDKFSKSGAILLAETIVKFWYKRGHIGVRAWSYRLRDGANDWGVRSNLHNGLPLDHKANRSNKVR